MKIIIEDRGKRYEVVRCGTACSFCKFDSPEEYCSKRCYAPRRFFKAIQRLAENGCGFKEEGEMKPPYCENCKYFVTEVMMGGRPIGYVGNCRNRNHHKSTAEADDYCPHHERAKWAMEEVNDANA